MSKTKLLRVTDEQAALIKKAAHRAETTQQELMLQAILKECDRLLKKKTAQK